MQMLEKVYSHENCIKAVVVDYYGTLVDVGQPFEQIKQWLANTYINHKSSINSIFMAFIKESARLQCDDEFYLGYELLLKSYAKSCDKYNIPFYPDMFKKLVFNLFIQPSAFPEAQKTMKKLRNHYPVLLLTNADNEILYKSISKKGFEFDFIVSSEDLKCNKPNLKAFKTACDLLDTPPEFVLMIGDSLTEDIYGAINYGMQAIWLNSSKKKIEDSIIQIESISEISSVLSL